MTTVPASARRSPPTRAVRRCRSLVLVVALLALAVKLVMAATTFGTSDIGRWKQFAQAVKQVGPIRVYAVRFAPNLYNHPPLIGYFLVAINGLTNVGLPVKFSIRAAASLADVASTVLVFEVLRRRRHLREATAAGVLVAVSPVLFSVSGFHGNTDSIFTMLTLLCLFLLADRQMPATAGVVLAAALSIKIVPVVVVPSLLLYASAKGPRTLRRFSSGLGAVLLLIWTPALLSEWGPLRHNVLGYRGSPVRHPWGLPQFAQWMGFPGLSIRLTGSGGSLVAVLVCAAVPAVFVWRKPWLVAEAVGLAMAAFLLLSPAFAVQYLVWPLIFCYLVTFWSATAYNVLAGAWLVNVYTRWSGGFLWDAAHNPGGGFTFPERVSVAVVWGALLVVVGQGVWRLASTTPTADARGC